MDNLQVPIILKYIRLIAMEENINLLDFMNFEVDWIERRWKNERTIERGINRKQNHQKIVLNLRRKYYKNEVAQRT